MARHLLPIATHPRVRFSGGVTTWTSSRTPSVSASRRARSVSQIPWDAICAHSFRGLLRRPTFTLAAVLTLALGIGANTAVFSVVNAVLLKPLSYPQSNELVSLQHVAPGLNSGALGLSPDLYFTYRDENRTFEHLGVFGDGGATVTGVGDPEQARTRFVSDGVLQALGVQPMLGRWFSEADHAPQAASPVFQLGATVILTYAYWQRKFGGDPGVIGRSMSIDSRPTEIVGVMPAGFRFLNMTPEAELILPVPARSQPSGSLAGFGGLQGIGRLKPGVTLADAQADAARMLPIWLDAWPAAPGGAAARRGRELACRAGVRVAQGHDRRQHRQHALGADGHDRRGVR